MSVVARMAPVAERQHAVAHLRQLRELGIEKARLEHAVAAGTLERARPEVYRLPGSPPTWRQQLMAAVLDGGEGAAASHRAAARLLRMAHRDAPELVEISVASTQSGRMPGVIVHRSGDLEPDHVMVQDGIPCTGPLRTLVDLGAVEPLMVVSDAFERALQADQATLRGAEWMLTELSQRGRAGCGVFRRVLDERALAAVSPDPGLLEPRMARLLRASGLPFPAYQHVVAVGTRFVARVDFAYVEIKEAFEVDGFEKHGTPEAMGAGFERDHLLRAAGWNVSHFNWQHVVRRPKYVESVVRSVLRAHSLL
jgi:very-short-patch-repair endonuclease